MLIKIILNIKTGCYSKNMITVNIKAGIKKKIIRGARKILSKKTREIINDGD
jgi:hypothetical protein